MPDTPVISHAPTPAPISTTPSVLPVERPTVNAPVVAALAGLIAITAAAAAGVLALAGVL